MKHYYIVLYNLDMTKLTDKKYILFDLDGTLTDSYPAITTSFLYAVQGYDRTSFTADELSSIIGPPLKDSFMRLLGVDGFEAWELVKKYREYYNAGGMYNCKVYQGIEVLLKELSNNGYKVVVATSKPEVQAIKVLSHFGLDKYFTLIAGDDENCSRANKKDVITYCLNRLGSPSVQEVVMVGDRKYDMLGAKELGITAIGVTYGYGSHSELSSSGADFIVNNANELKELFL